MVYKRAAKEQMDVDKLTYSKMLEQKKITQEEYDCLLLKKVTTGLGYREIAEAIKVDGTLYCDDDMVKVMKMIFLSMIKIILICKCFLNYKE